MHRDGNRRFVGENPPNEAVVSYLVKKTVPDLKLRVSDAGGKTVREINVPSVKDLPKLPESPRLPRAN